MIILITYRIGKLVQYKEYFTLSNRFGWDMNRTTQLISIWMAHEYFRSAKSLAKKETLGEQGMPRAAKDLMKRQLVMEKTAVKKRTVKKQKKTGKYEVHTVTI